MSDLSSTTVHPDTNILELVCGAFARHVDAKPHHIVGLGLWALHTHIHRRYDKSPRLAIISPVPNCGKSSVLNVLNSIVWKPEKIIDPTNAAIQRLANYHTLLLDEADNMTIVKSMRATLNAGHEAGGVSPRVGKDGEVINYPVYGPLALASIGRLPTSLMSRSIVIPMHRSSKAMEPFNPREAFYYPEIVRWAEEVNLNPQPTMPPQIIGRYRDKWRPLIAIGHAVDRSLLAYETMAAFYNERTVPDLKESLLRDVQEVFLASKRDVLTTDMILGYLLNLENGEVDWSEHQLTKSKIARTLRDFQIENKVHRYEKTKMARCYFKADFEEMWERYA